MVILIFCTTFNRNLFYFGKNSAKSYSKHTQVVMWTGRYFCFISIELKCSQHILTKVSNI